MLIELKLRHHLSKVAVENFLKYANDVCTLNGVDNMFHKSFYLLEKDANFIKLKSKVGFYCPKSIKIGRILSKCNTKILIDCDDEKETIICPNCNQIVNSREIISTNHFFIFNLKQQLQLLLDNNEIVFPTPNPGNYFICLIYLKYIFNFFIL